MGAVDTRVGSYIPVPDAPQTIKQNWIPFLTFFFLRILICRSTGQRAVASGSRAGCGARLLAVETGQGWAYGIHG